MSFRTKITFALTVALLLLVCVMAPPRVAGEKPAGGNSATDNAAATKPAIDTSAAEEQAANDGAAKVAAAEAEKQAKKNADDKAAKKKYFEDNPLTVTCIEPYVGEDKGTCDPIDLKTATLGKAGMGDRIKIVINRLTEAAKYDVVDPARLVLFIDGRVFKDVTPESVGHDSVVYKLERTTNSIDAWNGLLGSPGLEPVKPVVVSVGYADQKPLDLDKDFPQQVDSKKQSNLNLIVYRKRWAVGSLIILILMLLVFWRYGGKDLLRDSGPVKAAPEKRPYSLARVQVAWWFFLVVGCFLLIYLITGEFTMTEQALILIGIGTGTALGSAMIENSKRGSSDDELELFRPQREKLDAEIKALRDDVAAIDANPGANDAEKAALKVSLDAKQISLAEKEEQLKGVKARILDAEASQEKPTSGGFLDDLLTDANGPSFHRFQMIVWTVILGVLFLAGVYKNLAMPAFSGTMLALMGISAGTYLGFKIPEKQNTPGSPPPAGGNPPPPGGGGGGQLPQEAAAAAQAAAAQAEQEAAAAAAQAEQEAAAAAAQAEQEAAAAAAQAQQEAANQNQAGGKPLEEESEG